MTRSHRVWHRRLWPILAILVALGFTVALTRRAPAAEPSNVTTGTTR